MRVPTPTPMSPQKSLSTVTLLVAAVATTGILVKHLPAQSSPPAVPCEDSDGGVNLSVKGTTKGFHAMDGQYFSAIYGTEPDPGIPKKTTDNFSILYDYCYLPDGVVEGECIDGKLTSYGHNCPYGCGDGACKTAPADAPPSITLSAQATTPTTWRPGGRGYYSTTVTDDKGLKTVIVTTSQMMYSSSTNQLWQCDGKTSCEEKVYIIVPTNPGAQFVTVTATDSAGQVSTKTVNFDAPACTADTDCGSSGIQWAGSSYCGSEAGSGLETDIMQYGVAATCKSGGICDTSSLPRLKQKCVAGQVCTYGSNGENFCIAQPSECATGAQVTSVCTCGNASFNYPYDWRVSSPRYCCSWNGSKNIMSDLCQTLPSSTASPSFPTCPKGPPNPYASCSCGGFTYNTSNSYCCIDSTTGKEYQSPTACPAAASTPTPSQATAAPTLPSSPAMPSPVSTPVVTPAASLSPTTSSIPSTNPTTPSPIATPPPHFASPNQLSVAEVRRETQLLKSRGKQTRTKLKNIEKSIVSLEKKIDGKLRLLDRVKKVEVQKRVRAQIDGWQRKIDSLEEQKEKLETTLEGLQKSLEQMRAGVEQ